MSRVCRPRFRDHSHPDSFARHSSVLRVFVFDVGSETGSDLPTSGDPVKMPQHVRNQRIPQRERKLQLVRRSHINPWLQCQVTCTHGQTSVRLRVLTRQQR